MQELAAWAESHGHWTFRKCGCMSLRATPEPYRETIERWCDLCFEELLQKSWEEDCKRYLGWMKR